MPKYTPLFDYLRKKSAPELVMSFADIEWVFGAMLPNSAAKPQWWANEQDQDARQLQTFAWLDAGYEAFLVSGTEKVRFRKQQPHH